MNDSYLVNHLIGFRIVVRFFSSSKRYVEKRNHCFRGHSRIFIISCGSMRCTSPYKLVLWKLYNVEGTYTPMYMTKDTVNDRSLGLRSATYVVIQHLSFFISDEKHSKT